MSKKDQCFSSLFRSFDGETYINGFSICFSNGARVSVQYADLSHCKNYPNNSSCFVLVNDASSPDAEVAIVYKNEFITGRYIKLSAPNRHIEDEIMGWVEPDELLNILLWAKNYEPD